MKTEGILRPKSHGVDYNKVEELVKHFPFHDWIGKYGTSFRLLGKKHLVGVVTQSDQIFIIENTRSLKIVERIDLNKTDQSLFRAKKIISQYFNK